ncbi:unnamed protein product [Ranitomeya imitator]|uniref:Uncharacterized protein n=1 Tax=Ranitomeya imitator TaxID=111125 RepID=A0ABN9MSU3_9NEOB|nr:unnamed protein product [Ranitomeya imitator]
MNGASAPRWGDSAYSSAVSCTAHGLHTDSIRVRYLFYTDPLTLTGSKVNLVKISATASSPRDTALAAVICSALSTVLLALLILSVIYCKRQFMEKKPNSSCYDKGLADHKKCSTLGQNCYVSTDHKSPIIQLGHTAAVSKSSHRLVDGNQGKHRVTKRGPALSYPMFTLVTGIVGRWRAVCVTALQRPNSDAAAIRIVVGIAAASLSVTVPLLQSLRE